jgi:polyisoprenoid-binding protein YceI
MMMKLSLLALFALAPITVPAPAPAVVRYVVAPAGNEARYRVRERLMGHDFPNDAVGTTTAITGGISIAKDGSVVPADSRFTIDVTTLRSDKDRRDGYVQRRILETDRYPVVVLEPTSLRGAKWPIAGPKKQSFDMAGMMTVHGVTRPTIWHVSAERSGREISGTSWTTFTFDDVSLARPRVPVVLSVADTIRLEYDFHLIREK